MKAVRRLGLSPKERGDSHDDHTCPDIILLDDNRIVVIGEVPVGDDAARLREQILTLGGDVAANEGIVIIGMNVFRHAVQDFQRSPEISGSVV